MRIAIDFDTVVDTDLSFWSGFITVLSLRHTVILVCSAYSQERAERELGDVVQQLCVLTGVQAQDYVGADVWIHGRPDRIIGASTVDYLHTKLNSGLTDSSIIQ